MPATDLQSLIVEITARNDKFDASLKSIEGQLGSFETKVNKSLKGVEGGFNGITGAIGKVTGALGAIAGVAALGGLTSLVKGALDAADSLGDTATQLGLTTDELQLFQFAANLSGVSSGTLTSAIVKLNVSIADSADKNSKASKSFKELGIETKNYRTTGEVVTAVLEKLATSQLSVAKQTDLLRDVAGRGSAQLIVMAQGFAEARKQAAEMGIVMDASVLKQAGELNDKWDTMSKVIQAKLLPALISIAPTLVDIAEKTVAVIGWFESWDQTITNLDLSLAARDITDIQSRLLKLGETVRSLEGVQFPFTENVRPQLEATRKEIEDLTKRLKELQDFRLQAQGGGVPTAPAAHVPLISPDQTAAAEKFSKALQDQIDKLKEHTGQLGLSGVALANYVAAQKTAEAAAAGNLEQMKPQIEALRQAMIADAARTESIQASTKALQEQAAAEKNNAGLRERLAVLTAQASVLDQAIDGTLGYADALKKFAALSDTAKNKDGALGKAIEETTESLTKRKAIVEELDEAERDRIDRLTESLSQQKELTDQIEDDNQANEERVKIITEGIKGWRDYKAILHDLAVTEEELRLKAAGFTGELRKQAEATVTSGEAAQQAAKDFSNYGDEVSRAALRTGDLENAITDVMRGSKSIGDVFEDLGQTAGERIVKGILFGKGQEEHAILDNFNQLLGVDAAGIFGKEGLNLGKLFGANLNTGMQSSTSGGGQGIFSNVIGGGSSTAGSAAGMSYGDAFGYAAIAAAAVSAGKAFSKGKYGSGGGAIVGGALGAYFSAGNPQITALAAQIGGFLGGFLDPLFKHIPTKGTRIRKNVKEFLKDIEVSFADEIDSNDYFFEETKKLADKMFGGNFLDASKQVLADKVGPDIGKQLQALGVAITADQAIKLGKSVEQTGTTFGNMLIDNLGIDDIPDAIAEIVDKAGFSFEGLTDKLTEVFEKSKVSSDFYTDAIEGAVSLFFSDLPEAINVSKIALESFTDDGIFSLSAFQDRLEEVTGTFDVVAQAFADAILNSHSGTEAAELFGAQLKEGLNNLALDAFIKDFIDNRLFAGIDLSDGLDSSEIELLTERTRQAREAIDHLRTAFDNLDDSANNVKKTASELVDEILALNQQLEDLANKRIQVKIDLITQLQSVGVLSDLEAIALQMDEINDLVRRAFAELDRPSGSIQGRRSVERTGPFTGLSDDLLQQMDDALTHMGDLLVQQFEAFRAARERALQEEIAAIQAALTARLDVIREEYDARRKAVQVTIDALREERTQIQENFRLRLDALQKELQLAQAFQQVAESLQQTIEQLVLSSSPLSEPEQLAFLQRRADDVRTQIKSAKPEDRPELFSKLSQILQSMLQEGQQFLNPTAFARLFESVITEIEALRDTAGGEGSRVEDIQKRIAEATQDMDASLKSIDEQIKAQEQYLQTLAEDENNAIAAAQAAAAAAIKAAQEKAAVDMIVEQEIVKARLTELAAARDAILREQVARAEEQRELLREQLRDQFGAEEAERILRDPMAATAANTLASSLALGRVEASLNEFLAKIKPAAQGYSGMVSRPSLFLAGERGPEHVAITPRGGMGGGVMVTIAPTYNVTLGTSGNPEADARRFLDAVQQHGMNEIRGGAWGQEIARQIRVRG